MNPNSQHPADDVLHGFAIGRLGDKLWDEVEGHISTCERCARRIEQLAAEDEFMLVVKQGNPHRDDMESTKAIDNGRRDLKFDSNAPDKTLRDTTSPPPQLPLRMLGHYEVGPEIGRGGMGIVYLAKETGLNREVALKVLPSSAHLRSADTERFRIEAQAAAQLNHDNIVPIYHVGQQEQTHFYAMKLIEGSDLGRLISLARQSTKSAHRLSDAAPQSGKQSQQAAKSGDTQKEADSNTNVDFSGASFCASMERKGHKSAAKIARSVAFIGEQVANALEHAHQRGIIHRDIKPSNLLLDADNRVWVTDFGLAHLQNSPSLTQSGDLVGTLRYMSPEQASGRRGLVDHRTDIYSLGVTLYELATLQRACRGRTVREILREVTFDRPPPVRKINPRLPSDLETIICKATERNPSDRYACAADLASDLKRFQRGERLAAKRINRLKRARDWLHDRPITATIMAASILMLLTVSSVFAAVYRNSFLMEQAGRRRAEGGRLLALSALYCNQNPGLAIALAMLGARGAPGFEADQAIMAAVNGNHELHTVPNSPTSPGRIIYSPDGKLALLCNHPMDFANGPTDAVLIEADTCRELQRFPSSTPITNGFFDLDGRFLLTGSNSHFHSTNRLQEGPVVLWNIKDGQRIKEFDNSRLLNFASQPFSRSPFRLLLPTTEGTAEIFDEQWQRIATLPCDEGMILDASFSPDGSRIAAAISDGTIILYGPDGRELHRYKSESAATHEQLSFSSDSTRLLVTSSRRAKLHDLGNLEAAPKFFETRLARMSADAKTLYVVSGTSGKYEIQIHSPALGRMIGSCQTNQFVSSFSLLGEGEFLAATTGKEIELFNARSGDKVGVCRGHQGSIKHVAVRPHSTQFITSSQDDTLRLWDIRTNLERRTLQLKLHRNSKPLNLAYSEDGQLAAVGSVQGYETVVLSQDGFREMSRLSGQLMEHMPDGRLVVVQDDTVAVWSADASRREVIKRLPTHKIVNVKLVAGSDTLLLSTIRGDLYSWNPSASLRRLTEFGERVLRLCVSKNGLLALCDLLDGSVFAIDLTTGNRTLVHTFSDSVNDFQIATNNDFAAFLVDGHQALIWNLKTNSPMQELSLGINRKVSLELVLDDKFMVTFEDDLAAEPKAQLWQISDGQLIDEQPLGRFLSYAIDQDNNSIAMASDRGAFFWDLQTSLLTPITDRPCAAIDIDGNLVYATTYSKEEASPDSAATDRRGIGLLEWDMDTMQMVNQDQTLPFLATSVAASNLSETVALSGSTYGAALINPGFSQLVTQNYGHSDALQMLSFVCGDDKLLTVPNQGVVLLHDVLDGSKTELGPYYEKIDASVVTPDKKFLILAVDGCLAKWNIESETLDERPNIGMAVVNELLVGDNGNLVIAVKESGVCIWDLRSASGQIEQIDFGQSIVACRLSPDRKSIFMIMREPVPQGQAKERPSQKNTLALVNLKTQQRTTIDLDFKAVDARYVNRGDSLAILSSAGQITVVDASSLEVLNTIADNRQIRGLLPTDSDSTLVAAVSERSLNAWDLRTSQRVVAADDLDISAMDALKLFRKWQFGSKRSDWILGYSKSEVFTYPTQPLEHALEIAPRKLTAAESELFHVPEEFFGTSL